MFWNNERRTTNMFLWGTITGVLAGIYATRWIMQNPMEKRKPEKPHSEQHGNVFSKMGEENKKELFETFINGNEAELEQKASEMNLKN